MKNSTINSKTIKELTDFLPIIYDDKIEVAKGPKKGEADLFGGYHIYHPSIEKFFELASQQYWQDYQYVENFSYQMIEQGEIEKASINQLKTILTWCNRVERFNEGHWEYVIKDDVIKRVLNRLIQINEN